MTDYKTHLRSLPTSDLLKEVDRHEKRLMEIDQKLKRIKKQINTPKNEIIKRTNYQLLRRSIVEH
jgi:peptidoglycan hydrolase CwlO-like protein